MPFSDFLLILRWWSALFFIGTAAFPLSRRLFPSWYDRGYFFSKAIGMAAASYFVYLAGTLHVIPFTGISIVVSLIVLFSAGMLGNTGSLKRLRELIACVKKKKTCLLTTVFQTLKEKQIILTTIFFEELFFFILILFWAWVKAHGPDIRGLEKFMDFGFVQSVLNSRFFPAPDMWYAGGTINYYYFGHLVLAVLTRLSGIDLSYTFNIMLATLFALTATMSFSIGIQLRQGILILENTIRKTRKRSLASSISIFTAGILTSFLVTLAGNMQTIYAFTKGYIGENVVPFWTILWNFSELPARLKDGLQIYWFANATRFIPFTIHEFPSYSFVVSDIHGHVLSLPFVILAIALIFEQFCRQKQTPIQTLFDPLRLIFFGFLSGILLMTNVPDGPMYGVLFFIIFYGTVRRNIVDWKSFYVCVVRPLIPVVLAGALTVLPFLFFFSSFVSGVAVNCPFSSVANTKFGPFIFESVEKCQRSPMWMLWLLWGFFWYAGIWLFVRNIWSKEQYDSPVNRILKVFFLFCLALIAFPEFFYFKDIYPAHFRSNTMFKLGYQAFIMWSISAGYVITHFLFDTRNEQKKEHHRITLFRFATQKNVRTLFFIILIPQFFLVAAYPVFSVRSFFGELKNYQGVYGLKWLENEFTDDWKAISWLKTKGLKRNGETPVIVEADGDSYTDYNHFSAFTGVPSVIGWGVHEWLWRGGYDIVAPRREDVRKIYESPDVSLTRSILERYHVQYVIIGKLEREKFQALREEKFLQLGKPVFQSGKTVIYEIGK